MRWVQQACRWVYQSFFFHYHCMLLSCQWAWFPPACPLTLSSSHDRCAPVLFDLDLMAKIRPQAASRQYSLVMPSLAPDKASVKDGESKLTSNHQTGMHVKLIFFTMGGGCTQTFCIKSLFRHLVFHVSLLCVDVFVFLILEQPASPTPKLVASYTMWTACVRACVYSSPGGRVMETAHLIAIKCQQELLTALALQLWSLVAVKSLTWRKPFN